MPTFAERVIAAPDSGPREHALFPARPPDAALRPLRVLHCLRAPVGGLFRHVLDLACEQADRGHAVGILADATTGNALTAAKFAAIAPRLALGVTLVPMRREPGLGDAAAAFAVLMAARRLSVDVLHGHGAKGGTYARLAAVMMRATGRGARCFYTPHGGSLHFGPDSLAGRVVSLTERALGRATDGLIFESAYARDVYRCNIGNRRVPQRVIANGLQQQDFVAHVASTDAAPFVFVGELRHLKGVDVLLQALAALQSRDSVRAVIVGDGPDAADLRDLARSLGLEGRVRFPGAMPAGQAFALGRCLVVPSRAESLPYVVLEAAAAGLPLIATEVGGIREIVAGTSTRLIPADDVAALAGAMAAVLDDPDGARTRAEALRASVARTFNVAAMTDAVLDFYATAAR
jgi:glycosyltransferase involved in cell wall biosynthesis